LAIALHVCILTEKNVITAMRRTFHILAFLLLMNCATNAEESLEALLAERRTVLKAIIEQLESEQKAGVGSFDALINAKVHLVRFELEHAPTLVERQKHQQEIVAILQEQLSLMEQLHHDGRRTASDLLAAKDRLLKEKIALLNLK
jgi:hypothetical protein